MVQSKCAHPAAFHPPGSGICLHSAKREEWVKYKRLCRTPSNTACCPIGERNVDSTPLLIMSNKGPLAPIKNNRGSCTFCSEAIKRTDFKRKKGPLTHHLLGRLQPMGKNAAYRQIMSAKKTRRTKKEGGKKNHDTLLALFAGRKSNFLTVSNKVDHGPSQHQKREFCDLAWLNVCELLPQNQEHVAHVSNAGTRVEDWVLG